MYIWWDISCRKGTSPGIQPCQSGAPCSDSLHPARSGAAVSRAGASQASTASCAPVGRNSGSRGGFQKCGQGSAACSSCAHTWNALRSMPSLEGQPNIFHQAWTFQREICCFSAYSVLWKKCHSGAFAFSFWSQGAVQARWKPSEWLCHVQSGAHILHTFARHLPLGKWSQSAGSPVICCNPPIGTKISARPLDFIICCWQTFSNTKKAPPQTLPAPLLDRKTVSCGTCSSSYNLSSIGKTKSHNRWAFRWDISCCCLNYAPRSGKDFVCCLVIQLKVGGSLSCRRSIPPQVDNQQKLRSNCLLYIY